MRECLCTEDGGGMVVLEEGEVEGCGGVIACLSFGGTTLLASPTQHTQLMVTRGGWVSC